MQAPIVTADGPNFQTNLIIFTRLLLLYRNTTDLASNEDRQPLKMNQPSNMKHNTTMTKMKMMKKKMKSLKHID